MLLLLFALGCFPVLDLSPLDTNDAADGTDSGIEDGGDGSDGDDGDSGGDDGDSAVPCPLSWPDADGDGFGAGTPTEDCELPDGRAAVDGDCDDADPSSHPGAALVCDDADHDCDGIADTEDGDGDGSPACEDGDDTNPDIHPGAEELCDSTDNDGDGSIDEDASDAPTWYEDADGDGLGDPRSTRMHCQPGDGWVENSDDCDDSDPTIAECSHPDTGA